MSTYDAIIIGAGHNGLILQAYLGKAGLKAICIDGDLLVGASTNDQIGFNRPFPGAGSYRTHLPRSYLCGSSSHPGGNVTGLPGYNAAQVTLGDLTIAARCQRT
jgi:phytoene dehydrogenase-like protein